MLRSISGQVRPPLVTVPRQVAVICPAEKLATEVGVMATVAPPSGSGLPTGGRLVVKLVPRLEPPNVAMPSPGAVMETPDVVPPLLLPPLVLQPLQPLLVATKSPKAVLPPPAAVGSTRVQVPPTSSTLGPKNAPPNCPVAALEKPAVPAPVGAPLVLVVPVNDALLARRLMLADSETEFHGVAAPPPAGVAIILLIVPVTPPEVKLAVRAMSPTSAPVEIPPLPEGT